MSKLQSAKRLSSHLQLYFDEYDDDRDALLRYSPAMNRAAVCLRYLNFLSSFWDSIGCAARKDL